MINAFNQKGRQGTQIFYEPTVLFDTVVPFEVINQAARSIVLHEGYQRSSFDRHMAEREFELEYGSILLGEVDVVTEYTSGPVVTGNFGFPDRGFMLTDANREKYYDIIKFLEFEVPGVFVYADYEIRIGTSDKNPLFFIDDYVEPDLERIKFLPMKDIIKVEIINPGVDLTAVAIDVTRKNGGVVSILTKTGFGSFNDEFIRNIHGRITPRIKGFRQAQEFYAPAFSLAEQYLKDKPDYRPTLYWEPYAILENGSAHLEFYTSNMTGTYRVIAEGIGRNGEIIHGTTLLNVTGDE